MTIYICRVCGNVFLKTEGECECYSVCDKCGEKILRIYKLIGLKE